MVGRMATSRRRERGTRVDPVAVGYEVERAAKQRFEAIANHAGVSGSVLFEQMVEHVELNDQGIPVWMPPRERDGELPIDSP